MIANVRVVHEAVHQCPPHMADDISNGRKVGSIRQRGDRLQVRLLAGRDLVTGKDVYLTATINGTDKAARKRAEDKLAEFRTRSSGNATPRRRSPCRTLWTNG